MLTKCHIEKCTGLAPMERSWNFKDSLRFFPEFFAFVVKKLDIKTGLLVRGGMSGLLTGGDLISKTGPFCCVLVFDGGSNKGATFSNGRLFLANTWGQIMKRHKPYFRMAKGQVLSTFYHVLNFRWYRVFIKNCVFFNSLTPIPCM